MGPLSDHLLETEVSGDISLYDAMTEQVTVLNETASDIWRLADGEHTVEQIVQLLAGAYRVAAEDIREDVGITVDQLLEARLLEIRSQ